MTEAPVHSTVFDPWVTRFETHGVEQVRLEDAIDWSAPLTLEAGERAVLVASLRRFQLGEDGDGERLIAAAEAAGDPSYARAVRWFVAEEQQHAALLARALERLGAAPLAGHWSDTAFVRLRRALGLATELAVLQVAELVALQYYGALATGSPDPVLRSVAARIVLDERRHVAFHADRLRAAAGGLGRLHRLVAGTAWTAVAAGTTAVVLLDHGRAMRLCGTGRARFVRAVAGGFRAVSADVLRRAG